MKVVHIIVGLNVGGAEMMLKRLVKARAAAGGGEQIVISLTDIGKVGDELVTLGINVEALGMRSFMDIPAIVSRLTRMIKLLQPDVVQTWMYHADLLGGIAARLAGVRNVIWGIRGTSIPQGFFSATQAVVCACAALSWFVPRVIVCCAESARRSHLSKGYSPRKLVVIPNGYELASFPPRDDGRRRVRAEFGFRPDQVVVGIVGRSDPLKDHGNFLRAAALIRAAYPSVRFLMVGRDIETNAEVVNIIKASGFEHGEVVFAGERSDVLDCLAAMDIFCLSSRSEGFPNVVCEAMAMGVPCVVTDVGDAQLIVGETGLVVPPQNAELLAGAFATMLEMGKGDRESIGIAARARVIEKFDIGVASRLFGDLHLAGGLSATKK